MQSVSGVVLGVDISGPSCCLSAEHQKDCNECRHQVDHSGKGGGKSMSLVKALFPSCPGYFCTTVSLLPHLTVQICYHCYVIVNITNSAYHMNTLCIGSAFMKY